MCLQKTFQGFYEFGNVRKLEVEHFHYYICIPKDQYYKDLLYLGNLHAIHEVHPMKLNFFCLHKIFQDFCVLDNAHKLEEAHFHCYICKPMGQYCKDLLYLGNHHAIHEVHPKKLYFFKILLLKISEICYNHCDLEVQLQKQIHELLDQSLILQQLKMVDLFYFFRLYYTKKELNQIQIRELLNPFAYLR